MLIIVSELLLSSWKGISVDSCTQAISDSTGKNSRNTHTCTQHTRETASSRAAASQSTNCGWTTPSATLASNSNPSPPPYPQSSASSPNTKPNVYTFAWTITAKRNCWSMWQRNWISWLLLISLGMKLLLLWCSIGSALPPGGTRVGSLLLLRISSWRNWRKIKILLGSIYPGGILNRGGRRARKLESNASMYLFFYSECSLQWALQLSRNSGFRQKH